MSWQPLPAYGSIRFLPTCGSRVRPGYSELGELSAVAYSGLSLALTHAQTIGVERNNFTCRLRFYDGREMHTFPTPIGAVKAHRRFFRRTRPGLRSVLEMQLTPLTVQTQRTPAAASSAILSRRSRLAVGRNL